MRKTTIGNFHELVDGQFFAKYCSWYFWFQ